MSQTAPVSDTERATLIQQIRDEFTFSYEGETPQRQREEEDLRFQVPDEQWTPDAKASRMGGVQGGITILPRPMLSISKIDQPIRLVMNQAWAAKLGVNVHPVSEEATDDTAEVLQDLYRRIERDSNANVARLWALDRAVKAGRGVYRIVVRPDEDGFQYGDLEVGLERMLHQGCVYFDPSAQLPDYSDGDFAYVTQWLRLEKVQRMFPGSRVAKTSARTEGISWANMKQDAPKWTKESGTGIRSVQIAERYWKKHHDELLLIVEMPGGGLKAVRDGIDKMPRGAKVKEERVRDRVEVWHYVTDGFEILEKPTQWLGKYIPLVPVLGRELQTFDDQRRIIGIIRNARDPQRFFNTSVSTLMEVLYSEPRTPWVGPEGFDEGRAAEWANANWMNIPVLKFKPTLIPGTQTAAPLPMRTPRDSTAMSIALESVREAALLCQDATAFFDPSLGKGSGGQQESGRKVLALQGQGDAANGDWLQQLAVAMRYEALAVLDLIAPADKDRVGVYDAPGRVTTVLGGEPEAPRTVMLNKPFVTDEASGRPREAQQGEKNATHYDLKAGARYGVSIDIGSSFKSRLQEADESTTRIVEAWPEGLGIIGDLVFGNKDFPGSKKIAERLEAMIRAQHPELFKDKDSPEQAAAKVQALETQLQQMGQQLEQAAQFVKTEQAKHQAQVQIEQFKTQASVEIEKAKAQLQLQLQGMKNAGAMAVAELNARAKGVSITQEALSSAAALTEEQEQETRENAKDRELKLDIHRDDMAHDVAMAAAGGSTVKRTTDRGQEQDREESKETSQGGSQSRDDSSESGTAPEPQADGGGD